MDFSISFELIPLIISLLWLEISYGIFIADEKNLFSASEIEPNQ